MLLPTHCWPGYGGNIKFRGPRILAVTGDVTLPPNNFTFAGGLYEAYYEFTAINETVPIPAGNSTNSTTNGTEVSNSTVPTGEANSTNGTNSTGVLPPAKFITIAFKFNAPTEYFAVGWGAPGMIGADVWTFNFEDGIIIAADRKALGHFEPVPDVQNGGTQDIELLGYDIGSNYTTVKVRRLCVTNDTVNDNPIVPGMMEMCWAHHPGLIVQYHETFKGTLTQEMVYP